jgi:phage terminase Nu1 subunit (DNA packaging protein)
VPSTGGVKIGSSYDEARTRKVNAEAEIAELELATVHGTLVVAEDVVKAWEEVLGALKGKLMSIPTKAAPVVSAESEAGMCQDILEDLMNEALEELSNYDPSVNATETKGTTEASEDGNQNSKAASETKRKSVGRPRKKTRLTK